ncbi:Flp1 family type IVb pilin [Anaerocolumna sp. AGMB13025]|uniref:Flp1 family type IVb pilin n=1 Tax=Anaerocolumna sp. AGMB13025 TaxID=3039116 RepID=UPI00241CEC20|nr:Flp1 family type IVb pilin [Anaerocolumna sp. AGMB13025]WFR57555.1 Flp1 family type IVb pilin [Anaerocolumna sp. AGMB13025]
MNLIKEFIKEEEGIAIVEIILILVLLVGLVLIFRQKITDIVKNIIDSIAGDINSITK